MEQVKNSDSERTIKWYHAKTSNVVALLAIIGFFVLIMALFIFEVPDNNKDLMTYLVGSFSTTVIGGAIYYLFQYKKEESSSK